MEELHDFGAALAHVKGGGAIQRAGWNGKNLRVLARYPDEHSKMTLPFLYIEYPDSSRCPWLASQTDIMSNDWRLL